MKSDELDEILLNVQNSSFNRGLDHKGGYVNYEDRENQEIEEAKQALTKLFKEQMLEIIGEDEPSDKRVKGPEKRKYWGVVQFRRYYQNQLRQELRSAIKDDTMLLNGQDRQGR